MSAITSDLIPHLRQLFAAALIVSLPFVGLREIRRLQRFTSSARRLSVYRSVVLSSWAAGAVAVALTLPGNVLLLERSVADIPWLLGSDAAMVGADILLSSILVLYLAQMVYFGSTPARRVKYAKLAQYLRFILPVTQEERRWWLFVSLTAGICEEVLCRGFLLQFLSGKIEGGVPLGLTAAWLVSSVAFGLGHFYQGVKGIIGTAIVGAILGLLAILTGNLILPILVHALADAHALWTYRPQRDNPLEADRLVQGYDLKCES
jgi:membrane protease YdiL (CAAX protease family)